MEEIIINREALVKCSDGKCYPCIVLAQVTDFRNLLPAVKIEFINLRPEYVIMKKITVNLSAVIFAGQNDDYWKVIHAAQTMIEQSKTIRR